MPPRIAQWFGLALDDGGDEPVVDGGEVVVARVHPGEQAPLQVGHDPRTGSGPVAPLLVGAEVDGLHDGGGVGLAVGLRVAVVEAAPLVVVGAVQDGVDALGLVAGGDAVGVVVAVAGAGLDADAVGLLAADGDRGRLRVGQVVPSAGGGDRASSRAAPG